MGTGSGVGQGIASGRCIDGISRQPEVADDLRGVLLLSLAFMEHFPRSSPLARFEPPACVAWHGGDGVDATPSLDGAKEVFTCSGF